MPAPIKIIFRPARPVWRGRRVVSVSVPPNAYTEKNERAVVSPRDFTRDVAVASNDIRYTS